MPEKITVAVFMGGLSSEHDVSVCTGLEALQALDPERYDGFPVYVGLDNQWWVGDALRDVKHYIPDAALKRQLTRVSLDLGHAREGGRAVLRATGGGLMGRKAFPFDVALLAMHGSWGEDGTLQGVLTAEGIPFAGAGVGAMGVAINKLWTQQVAAAAGLPTLPSVLVRRGEMLDEAAAVAVLGAFPLFVKPNFLGSSIGARRVEDGAALGVALAEVFRMDTAALVQPCVANLAEYNVAVRRGADGALAASAIERPLRKGDLLSFADKYAHSGHNKLGLTQGMAAMDRVLNPPELEGGRGARITAWAKALFATLDMAGAPRLDFLADEATGEVWFNEINPLPGGFGAYLWEAAAPRVGFSALLADMLEEARTRVRTQARVVDPVGTGSALFRKRG